MRQAKRLSESTKRPPFRWRAEILSRLSAPGGLYNLGDALGFGSGLLIAYLGWWESTNTVDNVFSIGMRYVAGSPAAVALTIATAIFFGSGEAYHRAWSNGFPPDKKLTQIGDLFSGFGAIALGAGLYLLGNPVLAATSGLLHAAGKFGSAFGATLRHATKRSRHFRRGVLVPIGGGRRYVRQRRLAGAARLAEMRSHAIAYVAVCCVGAELLDVAGAFLGDPDGLRQNRRTVRVDFA